jgi:hypothetical protein
LLKIIQLKVIYVAHFDRCDGLYVPWLAPTQARWIFAANFGDVLRLSRGIDCGSCTAYLAIDVVWFHQIDGIQFPWPPLFRAIPICFLLSILTFVRVVCTVTKLALCTKRKERVQNRRM